MKRRTHVMLGIILGATSGCGDDSADQGSGGTTSSSGDATSTSSAASGGQGTGGQAGGMPTAEIITSFDAPSFELPEGLAATSNGLLVGFAFRSTVDTFDVDGGSRTAFASFPVPAPKPARSSARS
jgi:hypothetical protein